MERHLPYGITLCCLPPDTGEPVFFNSSQVGRYTIYLYPEGMDGWICLGGWLHTGRTHDPVQRLDCHAVKTSHRRKEIFSDCFVINLLYELLIQCHVCLFVCPCVSRSAVCFSVFFLHHLPVRKNRAKLNIYLALFLQFQSCILVWRTNF